MSHNPGMQAWLIVVMGVSGCGKTSLAARLAKTLCYNFIEADDLHSEVAKAKMAGGTPLDDQDREPWITAICEQVKHNKSNNLATVLACSALKKKHRDRFRKACPETTFLFLDGSEELIRSRMESRQDHFFKADMLRSQFEALEHPSDEPDVYALSAEPSLDDVLVNATTLLQDLKGASHL